MSKRDGVCVALEHQGEVLVVRTVRYPHVWQPIGGGIDPGERPVDAAIREVREETGLELSSDELVHVMDQPMDAHPGTLRFYRAPAEHRDVDIDQTEIVEHRWVATDQLATLDAFDAATAFFTHLR